jgi:hypothetical protein
MKGSTRALKLSDCMALIVDREPASVRSGAAMLHQIESLISPGVGVRWLVVPQAASAIARSHWVKTPLMFLHPDELFRLAHLELGQHLLARSARSGALVAA